MSWLSIIHLTTSALRQRCYHTPLAMSRTVPPIPSTTSGLRLCSVRNWITNETDTMSSYSQGLGEGRVRGHRVVGLAEDMAHTLYLTPNGMLRPTPHNVKMYDESRTHSARSLCKNSSSRSLLSAIRSDTEPAPSRLSSQMITCKLQMKSISTGAWRDGCSDSQLSAHMGEALGRCWAGHDALAIRPSSDT